MTSQQAVPAEPSAPAAGPRFAFDARRWTRYEAITLGLSLLLLFFLSGPWYDVRFVDGSPPGMFAHRRWRIAEITSVGGTDGHGYLWVTVLPLLIIVAILVLRAGFARVWFLIWPTDRQLLAGAACANLVVVCTAFLTKSGIVRVRRPRFPEWPAFFHLSIVWESGAYIALAIAAAAAVAAVINAIMARRRG